MKYWSKIACIMLLTVLLVSTMGLALAQGWDAERIHFNAIVIDTHNDTMMKVIDSSSWLPVIDIGGTTPSNFQLDIQKAKAGGLDVAFYAAYTGYQGTNTFFIDTYGIEGRTARTNSRMLALLNALYWNAERNPDDMVIATSLKDIEKGIRDGKHVAVPTLEGMYSLEEYNAIELLHQYYDLGVRAAAIVWNPANSLGAGTNVANDAPNAGLTELGKEVMREMNRLGIIIDVSHMNETTFFDTIAVSEVPIIASHSGADGIRPHVRNLSDEQLLALKENGGVAQVNFWNSVVANPGEIANISRLVDHIDYIVNLIGINHVGIGSDFDGANMPVDLPNASYLPGLTAELVARGYSRQDIEKILGGNTLRVLKEVQKHAEKHPSQVGQGITIEPSLKMGDIINDRTPLLTAQVSRKPGSLIDETGFRVIVDGIVYEPEYDAETGLLSLQMEDELLGSGPLNASGTSQMPGNFHVVTFEGRNNSGKVTRETVIFYVQ